MEVHLLRRQRRRPRVGGLGRRLAGGDDAVGAHRPGDVLHALLAEEGVVELEARADGVVDRAGDADAARLGQALQARGDVDAVAVDVAAVLDDVAEVDADAEGDAPALGQRGVARAELGLHGHRRGERVDDGVEARQHGVAGGVHHAPAVPGDGGVDDVEVGGQGAVGGVLVLARQAAVAGDVGVEDGGEPARQAFFVGHGGAVRWRRAGIIEG